MADQDFTVGVEEEFFIVDAETRALRPRAERVTATAGATLGDQVEMELHLAQIETATPVCSSLEKVRAALARSLTRVCHREELAGTPLETPPAEVLTAARWRAAWYGLEGRLAAVDERTIRPARDVVEYLLLHLREDLEEAGEWDRVVEAWKPVARDGSGAAACRLPAGGDARRGRRAGRGHGAWHRCRHLVTCSPRGHHPPADDPAG